MKIARALLIAVTAFASAAAAQDRPPQSRDMERFCRFDRSGPLIPRRAFEQGINGRVVLDCIVTEDRRLQTCEVVEETPPDMGFANSAFRIACRYAPNEGGVAISDNMDVTTDASGVTRLRQPFTFNINQ